LGKVPRTQTIKGDTEQKEVTLPRTVRLNGWQRQKIVLIAVAAVVVVLAVTVWPTRYRYDHVNLGESVLPVRIDRLSGRTEILYGWSGWVKTNDSTHIGPTIQELPAAEAAKVTGNARLAYGTLFEGKLYNGSSFYLRELIITITALEKSGETRWSRQFKDEIVIEPLTTGNFQIEVTGAKGAELQWTIDRLKGWPLPPP
jgi:hypothetical protein